MFKLECSDGMLDVNTIVKYFKPALKAVQDLPVRKFNGKTKTWSTSLKIETVIEMITPEKMAEKSYKKFPPNRQQKTIIDHVVDSKPGSHTLVKADAGTGKTATIIALSDFTPETIGAIAFNRTVANEITARSQKAITGFTFNSFGFRALSIRNVDAKKYYTIVSNMIDQETESGLIAPILKLFDLSRNMLSREYADLALQFSVDFTATDEKRIYNIIDGLYDLYRLPLKKVDFTDQLYVTYTKKYPLPYFDILAVDECQDINPLRYGLIELYMSQHPQSKILFVGDEKQAINGWSGTIDNAMGMLSQGATIFPLSLTYRNAQAIIEHVKECHPNVTTQTASQILGSVKTINFMQLLPAKDDMIVCKFNAPLVPVALQLIRQGQSAFIRGKDISGQLSYLMSKAGCKDLNSLEEKLNNFVYSISEKLSKNRLESYQDNVNTILAIAENCATIDCLYKTMKTLFSDKNGAVILSSIHRAKGLESKNVYILTLDEKQVLMCGEENTDNQENNVAYVARTRAIENLIYVVG